MAQMHHTHKHMTKKGDEIIFVFSCSCGERIARPTRHARDKAAETHDLAVIKERAGG